MSSTNRSAIRSPNDYYKTDPKEIVRFIDQWRHDEMRRAGWAPLFWTQPRKILDPAAGGLIGQVTIPQKGDKPPLVFMPSEMSYPKALAGLGQAHVIDTLDIRTNSMAAMIVDYLGCSDMTLQDQQYDLVITNPPFSLAIEFIKKSLHIVKPGGYVVMLLRLNFFGSEDRNKFFLDGNMPDTAYVHSKRLGFTPDGKTDSIEYMHAIWQRDMTGNPGCHETKLRVLPY